jgi:glyoxylase-like metal-dependent hydrolase (beta-lactamase superfamily II)
VALTIHPLDLGTLTVDKSGLTLRRGLGTKVDAPCLSYLILGGSGPTLVDSGPCRDGAWGTKYHNPFRRGPEQSMQSALAPHGLAPADIRRVVISHLHWDHCYGNADLPNARFVVQRRELAYAVAPLPCDAPIYETQLHPVHFLAAFDRFDVIDGEVEIEPGLRCVPLPGHTPGLQGVLVETATGRVMIVSDHCPLFENYEILVPTGIIHSLEDWYTSTARVRSLADRVLPGHDLRVLTAEGR